MKNHSLFKTLKQEIQGDIQIANLILNNKLLFILNDEFQDLVKDNRDKVNQMNEAEVSRCINLSRSKSIDNSKSIYNSKSDNEEIKINEHNDNIISYEDQLSNKIRQHFSTNEDYN